MPKEIDFIGLKKKVNPIYYEKMFPNKKYFQIYFGGSSSSKSYSQAQKIILGCLEGQNWLCLRKVASTIKKSIFNELISKIYSLKLNNRNQQIFTMNKTDLTITNSITGSQILMCGADDPEKIKSIVPQKGVVNNIWLEEATEFSYDDFKAIIKRLRGASDFKKTITLTFNPILKSHWIYTNFFENFWQDDKNFIEKENLSILKTTYKDNNFLAPEDILALESEDDKYYHDVYTLGNWGVLGAVIYKNWIVSNFNPNVFETYRNGVDWGFSNDEFAFIRLAVDFKKKIIYVCNEIYQRELLNSESARKVKTFVKGEMVYCDCAEPKSIEEYNRFGIRAIGVEKKAGSREEQIKFIKGFKIVIHPDCKNFQTEIAKYKFKESKDGEVLPVVVEKSDHLMDAMRYALSSDLDRGTSPYTRLLNFKISGRHEYF